jgi:hypothetical protein
LEAHAGRTDVKGTIGPSAACEFCETVRERRERRSIVVVGCIFALNKGLGGTELENFLSL